MNRTILRRGSIAVLLSAALVSLAPTITYAAGVAPPKATPVQREQAQRRLLKGRELYKSGKYDAALTEFNASLDIVASPNTRLYIARCLREMGRTVAAYVELGRAAVEAKELVHEDARYEQAAVAAQEERSQLEQKLGFVEVGVTHAAPTTTLRVSGDEVRRGGWAEPVPVLPGNVEVAVETAGRGPTAQTIAIRAGERKQIAIDAAADGTPEAPAAAAAPSDGKHDSRPRMRPIVFATAGVALAGLATFFIAGAMANGTYSDLEKACGNGPCPPGFAGDISAGRTEQTIANLGLGVFAVAGIASATLFVVGSKKPSSSAPASARVSVGPAFLTVRGAF